MPTFDGKKWFCEGAVPGKRFGKINHCFAVNKLIFKGKTPFQEIVIFDNPIFGRMAVLDGIVQFSERDEFMYHETIVHSIMFSHPDPKKVLIIGGGDGGALREVIKHPVKEVCLVDIDKQAMEIFKKYTPFISQGSFRDKRVEVFGDDGLNFIKKYKNYFDIIIIDVNDPVGPSLSLFSPVFYKNVYGALKKEGMMVTLIGSFIDFDSLIKNKITEIKKIFKSVKTYRVAITSYHCGDFCFIGASKAINLEKASKNIGKKFLKFKKKNTLKYYSPEMHLASMTLPKIWKID